MADSLDEIDIKLLSELEHDAERTNAQLAGLVGLSPAATFNRIRRLKDSGVISAVVARVDPARVGFPLQVYVAVTLSRHDEASHKRFAEAVAKMPEVLSADWVTGRPTRCCGSSPRTSPSCSACCCCCPRAGARRA